MNTSENMIQSYDKVLDTKYGAVGTEEREEFLVVLHGVYLLVSPLRYVAGVGNKCDGSV